MGKRQSWEDAAHLLFHGTTWKLAAPSLLLDDTAGELGHPDQNLSKAKVPTPGRERGSKSVERGRRGPNWKTRRQKKDLQELDERGDRLWGADTKHFDWDIGQITGMEGRKGIDRRLVDEDFEPGLGEGGSKERNTTGVFVDTNNVIT